MSINVNVQLNKDQKLVVESHSYTDSSDPFVTLDIAVPGQGRVAVFLRNVDDARRLVDEAVEAYRKVEAFELQRRIDSVVGDLPVFGGNTVNGNGSEELENVIHEFSDTITDIGNIPVFGGDAVSEDDYNEWLKGGGDRSY